MAVRVLVVEDDQDLCGLIARYLRRIGYETETAFTGEEALAIVDQCEVPFALYLVDLSLPGITGADFAGRILAGQSGARVLLTSGYPVDMTGFGPDSSRVSFILKPFPPPQLAAELERLMGRTSGR